MSEKIDKAKIAEFLADNGFIVIFALWCIFLSAAARNFLTLGNQMTILRQASIVGIVAIGEAIIVLTGSGMDISLAAILGLSGVIVSDLMVSAGLPVPLAVSVGLVIGVGVGVINGLLVTKVRINGIVVTLGMMYALEGAAFMYTKGQTVFGDQMKLIAALSRGYAGPVPVPVILLFLFYIIAYYILNYTVFGAHAYAVGNNEQTSWLSGIKVDRLRVSGYAAAGLLAGFGGVMQVARMGSATAGMGAEFLFPVLTAVILGGFSLSGGRGKIHNVLIAAIFLTTINNGLILLDVSIYAQKIISGVILVLALSLDRLRSRGR